MVSSIIQTARFFLDFIKSLVSRCIRIWMDNDITFRAAALTYYMLFAVIPLLSILITVSTILINKQFIATKAHEYIGSLFADPVATRLQEFVASLVGSDYSLTLSIGGAIILLYASTTYFARLNHVVGEVATNSNNKIELVASLQHRIRSIAYTFFIFVFIAILSATQAVFKTVALELSFGAPIMLQVLVIELIGIIVSILLLATLLMIYYRSVLGRVASTRSMFLTSMLVSLAIYLVNILLSYMLNFSASFHDYGIFSAMLSAMIWLFLINVILLCGAGLIPDDGSNYQ